MKPNTSKSTTRDINLATRIAASDPNHLRWVAGAMVRELEALAREVTR